MITYLEYVWIDGINNTRSKTKIVYKNIVNVSELDEWNYDGSSTEQATNDNSDVILKPQKMYSDPFRKNKNAYLVICDTYDKDYNPLKTNYRNKCEEVNKKCKDFDPWFGIEQEYLIYDKTGKPYMWENENKPYDMDLVSYCAVGGDRSFGREIVEEHLDFCLYAGVKICGINSEVTPSQWEFQVGTLNALDVADDLWIARYILNRLSEKYNCWINYHPKPLLSYNGSSCHLNFSTKEMRDKNGIDEIFNACEKLKLKHKEHIKVYGEHNELRLSGKYETSNIDTFSYSVSHRGCSVRIPIFVNKNKCGYLEDRRSASNIDPYQITTIMLETVCLNI